MGKTEAISISHFVSDELFHSLPDTARTLLLAASPQRGEMDKHEGGVDLARYARGEVSWDDLTDSSRSLFISMRGGWEDVRRALLQIPHPLCGAVVEKGDTYFNTFRPTFHSSARATVDDASRDGRYTEVRADGYYIAMEVPADQYEEALDCMRAKIEAGSVPGVKLAEAERLVVQNEYTLADVRAFWPSLVHECR